MRAAPLLLIVLVLVGCGSAEMAAKRSADTAAASARMAGEQAKADLKAPADLAGGYFGSGRTTVAAAATAQPQLASFVPPMPRMIVRNAELTLRMDDIANGEKRVGQVVRSVGGDVEASQSADLSGPSPSMSITLRVPVTRFDEAMTRLEGLGTRLSKSISSDDVTDQAVDMDARLKSLRVQEDAYRAILGAARKISDVLEVQERLTGVRTEIEQIVAQRRNLGDSAARSKIVVSLTQSALPQAPPSEPDWAAQSWGNATGALRAFGRSLAQIGIWMAAMLPVWLPLVLAIVFGLRRTRRAFPS
jgi:hypothetical protein